MNLLNGIKRSLHQESVMTPRLGHDPDFKHVPEEVLQLWIEARDTILVLLHTDLSVYKFADEKLNSQKMQELQNKIDNIHSDFKEKYGEMISRGLLPRDAEGFTVAGSQKTRNLTEPNISSIHDNLNLNNELDLTGIILKKIIPFDTPKLETDLDFYHLSEDALKQWIEYRDNRLKNLNSEYSFCKGIDKEHENLEKIKSKIKNFDRNLKQDFGGYISLGISPHNAKEWKSTILLNPHINPLEWEKYIVSYVEVEDAIIRERFKASLKQAILDNGEEIDESFSEKFDEEFAIKNFQESVMEKYQELFDAEEKTKIFPISERQNISLNILMSSEIIDTRSLTRSMTPSLMSPTYWEGAPERDASIMKKIAAVFSTVTNNNVLYEDVASPKF